MYGEAAPGACGSLPRPGPDRPTACSRDRPRDGPKGHLRGDRGAPGPGTAVALRLEPDRHAGVTSAGPKRGGGVAHVEVKRLRSLDILRGVAILMVFAAHVDPRTSAVIGTLSGAGAFAFWFVHRIGRTGVELFFVLSGFLIGGLLFDELKRTGRVDCWRFWMRRGFKIWPSYYLLLLVLAVAGTTSYVDWSSAGSALRSLAMHVFFLQNYLPDNLNGPTWSLAVEEHFYVFLPLVLVGVLALARRLGGDWRRYVPAATLAVVIACLLLRVVALRAGLGPWDFARSHLRMDALMIGVYCRFLDATGSGIVARLARHRSLWLVVGLALVLPAGLVEREHPLMFTVGFLLMSIGDAILLLLVYGGLLGRAEKGPVMAAVAKVGTWSYNIYLWHAFVPLVPFPFYPALHAAIGRAVTWAPLQFLLHVALFVGYSILVGWAATRLVEDPVLKLRNRWFPVSRRAAAEGAPAAGPAPAPALPAPALP